MCLQLSFWVWALLHKIQTKYTKSKKIIVLQFLFSPAPEVNKRQSQAYKHNFTLFGGRLHWPDFYLRWPNCVRGAWCVCSKMATGRSVDDLVHSANLYIPRHLLLHGYILPFLILYGLWSYCWLAIFETDFHFEVGYICLAVVGLLQLLTVLCCHWSVHVKCALTCKYVCFRSRFLWQKKLLKLLKFAGTRSIQSGSGQSCANGEQRVGRTCWLTVF